MSVFWWVNIENTSGTIQGDGPLQPLRWRSTARLDKIGDFEFEIPATDPRLSLVQQKYIARCWAIINGTKTEVGAGVVESISLRLSAGQWNVVVSGPDLLSELRRTLVDKRVIVALVSYFYQPTYINDDEIPYKLVANYANAKLDSTWTLANEAGTTIGSGTAVTSTAVYARFRNESVLNALARLAAITGEHFRLGSSRTVEWLNGTGDFADSGVRAIYNQEAIAAESYSYTTQIAIIERMEDSQGLVNRVFLYGAGEGDNRFTIRAVDEWPDGTALSSSPSSRTIGGRNYAVAFDATSSALDSSFDCLQDSTSITSYGVHEASVQFKNIAPLSNTDADVTYAANQLLRAGYEYLLQNALPVESYRLNLLGCNSILEPGTTIPVQAQQFRDGEQPIDINATLNILEATVELDAQALRTTGLVVSTGTRQPQTTGDVIVASTQDSYVAAAHPQLGPNVDTLTFQEDFDDSKGATLNFWMGAEIAQVQQVLLRFKIDPLRSTVESVAGSSTTTSSGGGSTPTTSSGGGSTPTTGTGNHVHPLQIPPGTVAFSVGVDGGGGIVNNSGSTVTPSTQFETGGHTHGVTISNHDHTVTIASHTHDVTPNLSTTYGIFEDSGGTVITTPTSECNFFINGNAVSASDIDSTGVTGWYQIDLTDLAATGYDLIGADTKRPVRIDNVITLLADTGLRGRITAQLQIRASIQSIAYSL